MTNFDYLAAIPAFSSFADTAIAAEKVYNIDPATSAINSRRALEFAIRWLYSVDKSLPKDLWQDNLGTMMHTDEFRRLIGRDHYLRIDYIRILGNTAAHNPKKISKDQAALSLQNLFLFLDFIAYCYAPNYQERAFNPELLKEAGTPTKDSTVEKTLEDLIKENARLSEELSKRREEREQSYVQKPLEISEYQTRKIYIDTDLQSLGWTLNKDWINEYELQGMPNASNVGYADYVLFGDNGRPLALIEAKRTCKGISEGRQQAKLYADLLEKKFGVRPVIFLSNGFDTSIIDGVYPERKVSSFYSKRDLEKAFNLHSHRTPLMNLEIDDSISNRYYQKEAIKAVCDSFDENNRRKALLVMATGSGKTRTIISLVDILLKHKWVKNVLFLADRTPLVIQAKRAFTNLLPNVTLTNLCQDKTSVSKARVVFSTYQTMQNSIDSLKDENGGKLFSSGHFDLIIVDEAHRSIYNKYKDIFTYFDSFLVGLTATPKEDIDKNTYNIFELENGVPTYGYDLGQAVKDHYLVDYTSVETEIKFLTKGVLYDDLTREEQEEYERLFTDEEGNVPPSINAAAINRWLFNADTIRKVLAIVMQNAIHVDYGSKIGKTVIFAANHQHAQKIYEIFGQQYPNYGPEFCRVIDNYTNYAQSLIDDFGTNTKLPQIAISVDMLDTGIDIPEIVNLVFFKKVYSKAKFWQMIGRGTRLCPGLLDGKNKDRFLIFDFCGNFEFFKQNPKGKDVPAEESLQARIYNLKNLMILKLQDAKFKDHLPYRESLVDDVTRKVQELNRENFNVRQHLKYIDTYRTKEAYAAITYEITQDLKTHVSPLLTIDDDDPDALYFDYLMYGIEYGTLAAANPSYLIKEVVRKLIEVTKLSSIPEVRIKIPLIENVIEPNYLKTADIETCEKIRKELRDLIKYIPLEKRSPVYTDFEDEAGDTTWTQGEHGDEYLSSYREKAEHYLKEHENDAVILKLKTNVPLTASDIKDLEKILWKDVGTKQDYTKEIGEKPLGVFVREIVGLDMQAAKDAFSKYLSLTSLNPNQSYFVNKIIEYIVRNGMLNDNHVLMKSPFTDRGNVSDLFGENMDIWNNIMTAISCINKNAETA